ncbi:hypothetical protein BVRB_1g012800 [Beta vulgaris subsp. vulgaris]|uniref:probable hexosyltransferase MUCI70 n=1 Tax=Beta vulgaris subsp. vulgaris TaxID=3555 RepID=UPI00053FA538|nr:probable hexosyltransferase MUCI70 [Beta vulgaris subsp. vulgaris]XP_010683941.1 probable hexosyltransferase MUCI70 [Beta vulgaris subsp. vulgaris]KMT19272.1 hypothetical protein BVRB_1g012800 [Beta vulgaris subsp. vulgaris]
MQTMFNGNSSITIPVSDDDSDEYTTKMRYRNRRKRKKSVSIRSNAELTRRVVRKIAKWWPLLLFLPAMALLLFEASRLSRNSVPHTKSTHIHVDHNIPHTNFNHVQPIYHTVAGVRQRCLTILSADDLELLDIPMVKGSKAPVKNVVYISEDSNPYAGENSTFSHQKTEAGRFNLFTGYQSPVQREKSFKVTETPVVHCGFFSENGGFKISHEDKEYLHTCNIVVSTCAFGGGDDLYQPIGMSKASLRKVCYVAFWDEITLATQEKQGRTVGDDHFIGKWRIVIVRNLPFMDQRLNGKIPKMLGHRLFPSAEYSIWVDSKSQFRRDPLGVLEALLWRSNSVLAISQHGARSSVYDEAKAVVKKNKATPEEVEVQLSQYHTDGLPDDKRFNGRKALAEASIIIREHSPLTNLFMCLWFNEVVRFTSRDQLSFPYVLWRLKVLNDINMFPVCTRKDLVNSMGHIRKAKPLVT